MQVATVLLPYVLVAIVLLVAAALRSWEVFDARVDLLLAAILSLLAAIVAGSIDLGTDVISYRIVYSQLGEIGASANWWEPGFNAVARLFAWAGAPYGLFVFFCVLTSHFIKLYIFNQLVFNRLLAMFIVFCLSVGEVAFVRQYLAASVVLLAYFLLSRRKIWSAVLAIVFATLIHKTALLAGGVLLALFYGIRSIWPLTSVGAVVVAVALAFPGGVGAILGRIESQVASYVVEGYVQGYLSSQLSLFRNVAKFPGYILFVLWMMLLSSRSAVSDAQKKSDQFVMVFSILCMSMILFISPVFTRLNMYVVPFIALSIRPERFKPYVSQFAGQYVAAGAFIFYLIVTIYPLADYF
jgi:hypothetical protein